MFKKILIANRGEIAVRVTRACREMRITTAAVYSEVDRKSLHVRYADEAYPIGPAPSSESYLRIDRLVAAARQCGAEAIHPGYGFLAENPQFARACQDAGIVFIGPPFAAMELLGSKTASRQAVIKAGLPVVPGTDRNLESFAEVERIAGEIGYPVMLKAAAGGGGKGLRLVQSPSELESAYRNARSEAQNAFNDPSVYIEKYIERPRHVEIQILGDQHGNLLYLGERECSLQRRHQKVMEECPSPLMDEALRRYMGETAVRIAKLAGYFNAGTVEFLVDQKRNFYFLEMNTRLQVEHPITEMVLGIDLVKEQVRIAAGEALTWRQEDVGMRGAAIECLMGPDKQFYFLEMNTRLQVEHPVTEMVWGVDLVKEQLRVARGETLSLKQEDLKPSGHAIECRIYADDPSRKFAPSPGLIRYINLPQGPGVRNENGVYAGYTVPIYYDPMLSKLVCHGQSRDEAIDRMKRALTEYRVDGIDTTIPFFSWLMDHPDFRAAKFDTSFIDRHLPEMDLERHGGSEANVEAAIAAAAIMAFEDSQRVPVPDESESAWRSMARLESVRGRL